jgi:hypothetical protein
MKKCTDCKIELEEEQFSKDKSRGDGLNCRCKRCSTERHREYVRRNKEKISSHNKKSYERHKEKRKQYAKNNYEHVKQVRKLREDDLKKYQKEWQQNNKQKRNEQAKNWQRNRKKNDPKYKIDSVISTSIYQSLKIFNLSKSKCGWQDAVGYTLKELTEHLESQFDESMNWDNYGSYWHIDHIKPKSLFVFESLEDEQFKQCWALNNLRPLEAKENIRKSNKYMPMMAESE